MLQILIDGQESIKDDIKKLEKKVDIGFKEVNRRLDKQGKSLAYLEDDAPTREEHGKLEKRVTRVEKKLQIQTA